MSRQLNTFSLYQAVFTLALASLHLSLCDQAHDVWTVVAIVSSFWFFLILPALIIWNVGLVLLDAFKGKPFARQRLVYFALTLPGFILFSVAISKGCYVTA